MQITSVLIVMLIILAGSCVQSALGFGTTMITMGFLPRFSAKSSMRSSGSAVCGSLSAT